MGGGILQLGLSDNVVIDNNVILLNESFAEGGGILLIGEAVPGRRAGDRPQRGDRQRHDQPEPDPGEPRRQQRGRHHDPVRQRAGRAGEPGRPDDVVPRRHPEQHDRQQRGVAPCRRNRGGRRREHQHPPQHDRPQRQHGDRPGSVRRPVQPPLPVQLRARGAHRGERRRREFRIGRAGGGHRLAAALREPGQRPAGHHRASRTNVHGPGPVQQHHLAQPRVLLGSDAQQLLRKPYPGGG